MRATTTADSKPTRSQVALLLLGCLVTPVLALGIFYGIDRAVDLSDDYRLLEFEYVVSHEAQPPQHSADWVVYDRAFDAPNEPFASVWFRTNIKDRLLDDQPNVLYVPALYGTFGAWLQGSMRYATGPFSKPLAYVTSPLLVPLGNFDSSPEAIWLYVRYANERGNIYPTEVYLGPPSVLRDAYDHMVRIKVTYPTVVVVVALTMILLATGLFLLRPKQTMFGWFALYIFFLVLHTSHQLVDQIPLPHELWFSLAYLALAWLPCNSVFLNRFFEFQAPVMERILLVVTSLLGVVLLAPALFDWSVDIISVTRRLWLHWIQLVSLVVFAQCIIAVRKRWSADSIGLALIAAVVIGVGIRDYFFDWYYDLVPGTTYYLQFVALLPLIYFGVFLTRRFVQTVRASEALNAELEQRVQDKAEQLEESFRQLHKEEKKREIAEERARIMRDMHDGLGGHLVHALSLAEKDEDRSDLRNALRYALSDLRLIVDSLTPSEEGFDVLIANFRHRVSKAVSRAGVELNWSLNDLDAVDLRSDQALAVLRIIQEATTNALRHADCTEISISIDREDDALIVEISDNGRGIQSSHRGRGIDNMKVRANSLGGTLELLPLDVGTTVRCEVPIQT